MANVLVAIAIALAGSAWSRGMPSSAPSAAVVSAPMHLEAETGTGMLDIRKRTRASGGRTVHLAPGERLSWLLEVGGSQTPYELEVTYANGREGPNETLHVSLDGVRIHTFVNRDSGDAVQGWETFVTDPGGSAFLAPGPHEVVIESEGGDGCVEIDFLRVTPRL